jgi:hypothetical protein
MTAPPYDATLLPAIDEAERCATHTERIDLDPGGTALWVDELIVVDVPLPWPKPVWAKGGFTAIPELVMEAGDRGRRVRVLAAVPLDDGITRVVTHELRNRSRFERTEHHLGPASPPDLVATLLNEGLDVDPGTVVSREPRRELLLCTQGSHDLCCGSLGTSLLGELETESGGRDLDVTIRRVSHTGGHRMAPTGLTLPDGRMWGRVDTDEMIAILARSVTPSSVAHRSRGWLGAAAGVEQIAERAVFAEVDDWNFDAGPRATEVVATSGDLALVEVTTAGGVWRVEVATGRTVPTIACGNAGGLPAKSATEWIVGSVRPNAPLSSPRPIAPL